MCGVVAAFGKIDYKVVDRLMDESEVRGTHNRTYSRLSPKTIIGHTRYCTSGITHQPINVNKRWVAFNGVISMATKIEMEREFGVKLRTDNDAELVLHLCETTFDLVAFIQRSNVSFAGVVSFAGNIFAVRNDKRPLWKTTVKGCDYIASTKDIFVRSGIKKPFELEPYKLYKWKI